VTSRTEIFLGVIAVATLAIAIVQIGLIVAAGMLARRILQLADRVDREITPLFGHLNAIGRDASRASALAAAQVERADRLFSDLAVRIEQTVSIVQSSIRAPIREGRALVGALRAGVRAVRELRQAARRRHGRSEDDDALFI
jgi:hypothetical protein